jgi:hypothetical protein
VAGLFSWRLYFGVSSMGSGLPAANHKIATSPFKWKGNALDGTWRAPSRSGRAPTCSRSRSADLIHATLARPQIQTNCNATIFVNSQESELSLVIALTTASFCIPARAQQVPPIRWKRRRGFEGACARSRASGSVAMPHSVAMPKSETYRLALRCTSW